MLWVKSYPITLPDYFAGLCQDFTENNDPAPKGMYESVADSSMWTIWNTNPDNYQNQTLLELRQNIQNITGANLNYPKGFLCIWRYDENFTNCPIHIDGQGTNSGDITPIKHAGSVCTSIHGEFKIRLHHRDTNEIVDSVPVTTSNVIVLNNTVYPHSVEGQGDLAVFGVDLQSNPEEFFAGEAPNV
jgi:hypothetical protein